MTGVQTCALPISGVGGVIGTFMSSDLDADNKVSHALYSGYLWLSFVVIECKGIVFLKIN